MEAALAAERWDAASLDAVHAVISANDAVLAFREGIRCAEQDHRAAAALLRDRLGAEAAAASKHVSFVVGRKNVVEYEQRRMSEAEADQIAEHARRFVRWAGQQVPRS